MTPNAMGVMWLRERAAVLRDAASNAERAYNPDSALGRMCHHVAAKYRKAAVLLDEAATEMEPGGSDEEVGK